MADTKPFRTADEKAMNGRRQGTLKTYESLFAEPPPYSLESGSSTRTPNSIASGSIYPSKDAPVVTQLDFTPSPLEIPTPVECIAHLRLLHAFAKLRHDVGNQDGLYGISMEAVGKQEQHSGQINESPGNGTQQPEGVHDTDAAIPSLETNSTVATDAALAERIRDKRWAIFVNKAVARYEKWWESLPCTSNTFTTPIRTHDFDLSDSGYGRIWRFTDEGGGLDTTSEFRLPPLDVLMVWHAHMLNPRIYLEDCIRYSKHMLWRTAFPWKLVHDSINDETFEYVSENTVNFAKRTGHPWDPLCDEGLRKLICPKCVAVNRVPWTRAPILSGSETLQAYLTDDTGYSGQAFSEPCVSCRFVLTHEKMRVGKFIEDVAGVLDESRPVAGTMLNIWGAPFGTTGGKKLGTHDAFFPHRVFQTQSDFRPNNLRANMDTLTIEGIKLKFQNILKHPWDVKYINWQQNNPELVAKGSRIAVRKVLSHYWDNSSMFGIDLVGAVLRQGSFVQKMRKLDWLHSPSLMSTVQRLIVKYHRFVRLAADYPKKTVVPTLDIDLAWHTHQLTPRVYYVYTLSETRKFLNHDDKIPESNLHTSFTWTSQTYEKKYGQPYSECSCWYCECTREPLRSNFLSKISSRRSSLSISTLDEKGFPKDPYSGPHISAHNALPSPSTSFSTNAAASAVTSTAAARRKELQDLDMQYAKVCKRYAKQQKKDSAAKQPPKKDDKDAYYYGAYGYPMYYYPIMPIYVPYYADPSCTAHTNAAGAGGGGGGGCAVGTCCPSASLGSCAGGEGTPGCKASCGGHGNADGGCGTCSSSSGGDGGDGGGDGGGCGGCGG